MKRNRVIGLGASVLLVVAMHARGSADPAPHLQILASEMAPTNLRLVWPAAFTISNGSASVATVEFDLAPSQQIPCLLEGRPNPLGNVIVIGAGESLTCSAASAGEFAFSVTRGGIVTQGVLSVQ